MKNILLSGKFLLPAISIGVIYLFVVIYLMNLRLVENTIWENYPLVYKVNIFLSLLAGMWTAMTRSALFTLITTSFLTGANLALIISKLHDFKRLGNFRIITGGGSILGVIGSGCVNCGLPIISLLGLGGSAVYLPFHGTELAYVAVGMLAFSFYNLLKNSSQRMICEIPDESTHDLTVGVSSFVAQRQGSIAPK